MTAWFWLCSFNPFPSIYLPVAENICLENPISRHCRNIMHVPHFLSPFPKSHCKSNKNMIPKALSSANLTVVIIGLEAV